MDKIKVLIVDDSAVIREVLSEVLASDPAIEVIGTAEDPYDARTKIKELKPDVLTLDIEMPKMDGITFLKNLMKLNPLPVVMLSTLTHKGADATLQALELGAVDYMPKPAVNQSDAALQQFQYEIISKVKMAAASLQKLKSRRMANSEKKVVTAQPVNHKSELIAIGSSTGGTEALRDIFQQLPANLPPIIISQHIPASFSTRLANRLDQVSEIAVKEAQEGDILQTGHAYLAPGSYHLKVKPHGYQLRLTLDNSLEVNRHKPSVEVMFDSAAELGGEKITALMLTGMGEDGAAAMLRLKEAGAHNIVQDEATSLVWGMPGTAVRLGAASEIVPLEKIAARLVKHLAS